MNKFSNLNSLEKPREKAKRYGIESLSNVELLAIIFNHGYKGCSILEMANNLLLEFGSIDNLFEASFNDLKKVKGISEIRALYIKAFDEIRKRMIYQEIENYFSLEKYIEKFKTKNKEKDEETLAIIILDKNEKVIYEKTLYQGLNNGGKISLKFLLKLLIEKRANSFYIFHNHLSSSKPSLNDVIFTEKLKKKTQEFEIEFKDHIIVSKTEHFSLLNPK